MNKIVIDNKENVIDSYIGCVNVSEVCNKLSVSGTCKLYFLDNIKDLTIDVLDNTNLEMYMYSDNKNFDSIVVINQFSNTNLRLYDAFKSASDVKESIVTNILGSNNKTNIDIRIVQIDGHSEVLEQINAKENTNNNEAVESLKGLVCGGAITTLPNMEIGTNNIVANHFVTISSYDKNELFYLMSRGIDLNLAKELIKSGYLFNKVDEKFKEVFYE